MPGPGTLRILGTIAARLAVATAVFMFVAMGGSHELLHLDEPAHAEMSHAGAGHTHAAPADKGTPSPDTPIHGCSAHCASAHYASPPPAGGPIAVPASLHASWRAAPAPPIHDRTPEQETRPPRA